MKNIYILLLALIPFFSLAQKNQGRVAFEETIKIEIDMKRFEGMPNADAIKAMIPKSQVNKKELFFSPEASLYKSVETEEAENVTEENQGAARMRMMMKRPEEQVYRDIKNDKVIENKDLFGKKFLVTDDSLEKPTWKMIPEQKEILGYPCMKAVIKDSTSNIEAWFTTAIPVPTGPYTFGQLPGMILQINMDVKNSKISAIATEVTFGDYSKSIVPPQKGKVVTKKEFKKIATEKAKEMKEMYGNGNVIIKTN